MPDWTVEEDRDFDRATLPLEGLCLLDYLSAPFTSIDVSLNGMLIKTDAKGRIGAPIRLDIDDLGVLEAAIVRITADGFAVRFNAKADRSVLTKLNVAIIKSLCNKF